MKKVFSLLENQMRPTSREDEQSGVWNLIPGVKTFKSLFSPTNCSFSPGNSHKRRLVSLASSLASPPLRQWTALRSEPRRGHFRLQLPLSFTPSTLPTQPPSQPHVLCVSTRPNRFVSVPDKGYKTNKSHGGARWAIKAAGGRRRAGLDAVRAEGVFAWVCWEWWQWGRNKRREGCTGEDGEPGCRWISGAQRQTWGGSLLGEDYTQQCRLKLNGLSRKNISPFHGPFLCSRESEFTKAWAIVIFYCFLVLTIMDVRLGKPKREKKNAKVTRKSEGHQS